MSLRLGFYPRAEIRLSFDRLPRQLAPHNHTDVLPIAVELEKPAQDISKAVLSTKLEQALRASSAIHEAPNVLDRLDIQLLAPSPVRLQLSAATQFCILRLLPSVACLT